MKEVPINLYPGQKGGHSGDLAFDLTLQVDCVWKEKPT